MNRGPGSYPPTRPGPAACALAKFMGGKPHPGKDRTSGYFGFAGHDDPVAFHNASIQPLD
jgi:hypothetical protein